MKEYRDYIRSLAKNNTNEVFFNSGPDHASLVMSTIFKKAKQYVKIYAANFSGQISGNQEYQLALGDYLSRGGKLQILLQKDKYNQQFVAHNKKPVIFNILRIFSVIRPSQINVKVHPFKLKDKQGSSEIHFTVADDKMYRIEEDISKFTAKGNFNNEVEAKALVTLFDDVWDSSETEKLVVL